MLTDKRKPVFIFGNFAVTKPGLYKYSIMNKIGRAPFFVEGTGVDISRDGWLTVSDDAGGPFVIFVDGEYIFGSFRGFVVNGGASRLIVT